MPLSIAKLASRRAACAFTYDGETVHLEYYPAALSADAVPTLNRFMADVNAAAANGDEAGAEAALRNLGAWTCTILASWDFLQEDEQTPEDITPENIAALLLRFTDFMLAVFQAIIDDRSAKNAHGTPSSANSAATSSLTENSALMTESLTPSDSSTSPAGSAAVAPPSNGC